VISPLAFDEGVPLVEGVAQSTDSIAIVDDDDGVHGRGRVTAVVDVVVVATLRGSARVRGGYRAAAAVDDAAVDAAADAGLGLGPARRRILLAALRAGDDRHGKRHGRGAVLMPIATNKEKG